MKSKNKYKNKLISRSYVQSVTAVVVVLAVAIIGVHLLVSSNAQSPYVTASAASGTLGGGASLENGNYVQFGFPPTNSLAIHVDGSNLVNGQGKVIRLLGVNASGTETQCVNNEGFSWYTLGPAEAKIIASWHINAVRVPLNEDCWLGINGSPAAYSGQAYQTAIENWVTDLSNAGITPILSLLWNAPGSLLSNNYSLGISDWRMPDEDHAPTFWTQVATAFKSNPSVIFDLFNEPNLGYAAPNAADWSCWLNGCTDTFQNTTYQVAGMQQLVNTVRATGATQPIMIGGLNASSDPCGTTDSDYKGTCMWLADKPVDRLSQLIVSYHSYIGHGCQSETCWSSTLASLKAANVPLVTSELGEGDCSDNYMDSLMDWADLPQNNVSYLAWAWVADGTTNTCTESPGISYQLLSNFNGTPNIYAPQGANFQAHLAIPSVNSTE